MRNIYFQILVAGEILAENTRLLKAESCSIPQISYRGNKHGIALDSFLFEQLYNKANATRQTLLIAVRTDRIISLIGTEFCNKECCEFIRTVLVFQ